MTKETRPSTEPSDAQRTFLNNFVPETARHIRLVAAPGTGKTFTATLAAKECVERGLVDSVLVLANRRVLVDHWINQLQLSGLKVEGSTADLAGLPPATVVATFEAALRLEGLDSQSVINAPKRLLVVVDEAHDMSPRLQEWVDRLLVSNNRTRVLSLVSPHQGISLDADRHRYDSEYFLDTPVLVHPATTIEIVKFAPTHAILQAILSRSTSIDDLSWRQFEKLVAELLESAGYKVELMRGTKDGGVDVVALLDRGPLGLFNTLWQAKKKEVGNKVGLSVIRELADTKNELGASKAYIVTSTYLTRDAIQRIERNQFVLGKVDRTDLDKWISSVLLGKHGA
jgi:HJR/Mrr/RecB family endonuclease